MSEETMKQELDAAKKKMEELEESLNDAKRDISLEQRKADRLQEDLEKAKEEADEKIKELQQ